MTRIVLQNKLNPNVKAVYTLMDIANIRGGRAIDMFTEPEKIAENGLDSWDAVISIAFNNGATAEFCIKNWEITFA